MRTGLDLFFSDKKAEIGSLLAVECSLHKFTGYEVKTVPELKLTIGEQTVRKKSVKVISGIRPLIRSKKPEFIMGNIADTLHRIDFGKEILFHALNLTRKVNMEKGFNEEARDAISTEEILALNRRFGLLEESYGLWTQHRIEGFELDHYKYRLFRLRWRFAIYWASVYEDIETLRNLVPIVKMTENERGGTRLSRQETLFLANEWLAMDTSELKTSLHYDRASGNFSLRSQARTFLEACDILLSLLIASSEDEGKNLKVCRNAECGNYFTGHGNAKYCSSCDRRTIWSRKRRRRVNQREDSK